MKNKERKLFCYLPWKGLNVDNYGIRPCCLYGNVVKADTIQEYENSVQLKTLKENMLNGVRDSGCERCWKSHDERTHVKPDGDFQYLFNGKEPDLTQEYETIAIFLTNVCNMQCNYCSPMVSSSIKKEYHSTFSGLHNDSATWNRMYFGRNVDTELEIPKTFMAYDTLSEQVIYDHAKSLKVIDISGGEPFYTNQSRHLSFLKKLLSLNSNIRLNYITNATVLPTDEVLSTLLQFKQVCFTMSTDAIGKGMEFIRYPVKWPEFYKNFQFYQELREKHRNKVDLSVSNTVSVYSIAGYNEFYTFAKENDFPHIFNNVVRRPPIMNVNVLPPSIRAMIAESLDQTIVPDTIVNCIDLSDTFDQKTYEYFIKATKAMEKHRGLYMKDYLPTLYAFIESDYKKI